MEWKVAWLCPEQWPYILIIRGYGHSKKSNFNFCQRALSKLECASRPVKWDGIQVFIGPIFNCWKIGQFCLEIMVISRKAEILGNFGEWSTHLKIRELMDATSNPLISIEFKKTCILSHFLYTMDAHSNPFNTLCYRGNSTLNCMCSVNTQEYSCWYALWVFLILHPPLPRTHPSTHT